MATLGRRRLSMAPPAWRPPGCSGSRFVCLGGLDADPSGLDGLDAAHVSVQVALDSLVEEGRRCPASPVARRPPRSDDELRQEFWSDVGFPTPESRFWERGSSASAGEVRVDANGGDGRRSSPAVVPAASSRRRWRGGPASSPSGLRLSRSPPRMGPWRGPIPPRRISPPPVLGDFLNKDFVGPPAMSAPEVASLEAPRPAAVVAAVSGGDVPVIAAVRAGDVGAQFPGVTLDGAHAHAANRDRLGSWEHLRRRFKAYWSRSVPASSSLARFSIAPPPLRYAAPASTSPSPALGSCSSSSPALRWPRSFAAVVAAPPANRMAGMPQRPSMGGGGGGGPPRPPATGLLHQQTPRPPQPVPQQGVLAGQPTVMGIAAGSSAPPGAQFPVPQVGGYPFRPLQPPSRQFGPPAFMPPQLMPYGQFMPQQMSSSVFPPYQQQAAPPSGVAVGQGASRAKKKKKKNGSSVAAVQVPQQVLPQMGYPPQQVAPFVQPQIVSSGPQQGVEMQGQLSGV